MAAPAAAAPRLSRSEALAGAAGRSREKELPPTRWAPLPLSLPRLWPFWILQEFLAPGAWFGYNRFENDR
jgi:hypothetical protein